jgi:hypothetical protein
MFNHPENKEFIKNDLKLNSVNLFQLIQKYLFIQRRLLKPSKNVRNYNSHLKSLSLDFKYFKIFDNICKYLTFNIANADLKVYF